MLLSRSRMYALCIASAAVVASMLVGAAPVVAFPVPQGSTMKCQDGQARHDFRPKIGVWPVRLPGLPSSTG